MVWSNPSQTPKHTQREPFLPTCRKENSINVTQDGVFLFIRLSVLLPCFLDLSQPQVLNKVIKGVHKSMRLSSSSSQIALLVYYPWILQHNRNIDHEHSTCLVFKCRKFGSKSCTLCCLNIIKWLYRDFFSNWLYDVAV